MIPGLIRAIPERDIKEIVFPIVLITVLTVYWSISFFLGTHFLEFKYEDSWKKISHSHVPETDKTLF